MNFILLPTDPSLFLRQSLSLKERLQFAVPVYNIKPAQGLELTKVHWTQVHGLTEVFLQVARPVHTTGEPNAVIEAE